MYYWDYFKNKAFKSLEIRWNCSCGSWHGVFTANGVEKLRFVTKKIRSLWQSSSSHSSSILSFSNDSLDTKYHTVRSWHHNRCHPLFPKSKEYLAGTCFGNDNEVKNEKQRVSSMICRRTDMSRVHKIWHSAWKIALIKMTTTSKNR